jgi:ribosomal protein S6E (S10)
MKAIAEEAWATGSGIREYYGRDYIQEWIETHSTDIMTDAPVDDKLAVYYEVERSVSEDLRGSIKFFYYFLAEFYEQKEDLLRLIQNDCALNDIIEVISIYEAIGRLWNDTFDTYDDCLHYAPWEDDLPELEKRRGEYTAQHFKKYDELTVEDYEDAFYQISASLRYLSDSTFCSDLLKLAARLNVYCKMEISDPVESEKAEVERNTRRIKHLLEKDIVQNIIRALGTRSLKRAQLAIDTGYEDAGHLGATLTQLKRDKILINERPFFRLNPEWYGRLGICPDKDGQ